MKPLKIGNTELESCLIQAALSGYSDWPMRQISRQMGAAYTVHEVMLEKFVVTAGDSKKNQHHFLVSEEEHPVGAQLMGSLPEHFGPAAERLVQSGFDVIDLNFACPAKRSSGKCRGGYLLSEPDVALEIIDRVKDVLPENVPLTVKMRRAFDESAESEDRFFQIFEGAFDRGVSSITVHGRFVMQKYRGPGDWNFLKSLKQNYPDKTLIGSGDLFTASDIADMLAFTGLDGVSIARGSIGNPWIFSQAKAVLQGESLPEPPDIFEQRDVINRHLEYCLEIYPPEKASTLMRKFGIYYSRVHPDARKVKEGFISVKSLESFREVMKTHYSSNGPGCYPEFPEVNPLASRAKNSPVPV